MARKPPSAQVLAQTLEALGVESGTMCEMEVAGERLKPVVGQAGLSKLLDELPPEDDTAKPCPKYSKPLRVRNQSVRRRPL